jgi:hypothetical protein
MMAEGDGGEHQRHGGARRPIALLALADEAIG